MDPIFGSPQTSTQGIAQAIAGPAPNFHLDDYREYLQTGGMMPHDQWMQMNRPATLGHEYVHRRDELGADQNALGPMEHRGFAYDMMRAHPYLGVPGLSVAIPAYTAAKALHILPTDATSSQPSMEEMLQGYKGMWEGLARNLLEGTKK